MLLNSSLFKPTAKPPNVLKIGFCRIRARAEATRAKGFNGLYWARGVQ